LLATGDRADHAAAFTTRLSGKCVHVFPKSFLRNDLPGRMSFTSAGGQVVKRAGQNARFSRPRDEFTPARFTNAAGIRGWW